MNVVDWPSIAAALCGYLSSVILAMGISTSVVGFVLGGGVGGFLFWFFF